MDYHQHEVLDIIRTYPRNKRIIYVLLDYLERHGIESDVFSMEKKEYSLYMDVKRQIVIISDEYNQVYYVDNNEDNGGVIATTDLCILLGRKNYHIYIAGYYMSGNPEDFNNDMINVLTYIGRDRGSYEIEFICKKWISFIDDRVHLEELGMIIQDMVEHLDYDEPYYNLYPSLKNLLSLMLV